MQVNEVAMQAIMSILRRTPRIAVRPATFSSMTHDGLIDGGAVKTCLDATYALR